MADVIGLPLAPEKTVGPATSLVFLGIQLCSLEMKASLPQHKVQQYVQDIKQFMAKSVTTLRQFQIIVGKLQLANTVVLPGRAFLRRLIDATRGKLSPHAKILVTTPMKQDLNVWLRFLASYNGSTFFIHDLPLHAPQIHLFTDASFMAGAGFMGRRWFVVQYPPSWHTYGIAFLELFPIVVALHIFGDYMRNRHVVFHTDNAAIVFIVNKQTSRSLQIMLLVRQMVLCALGSNTRCSAVHVPGEFNVLADQLSRLQGTPQLLKERGMRLQPEPIPTIFLPQNWKGS